MKKIECIIPGKKFMALESALRAHGIRGMSVCDVKGYGNEQTRPEAYLLLPKLKIELYCRDEETENILAVISTVCKTGSLGDGKVAVFEVSELLRIRTGERGDIAV